MYVAASPRGKDAQPSASTFAFLSVVAQFKVMNKHIKHMSPLCTRMCVSAHVCLCAHVRVLACVLVWLCGCLCVGVFLCVCGYGCMCVFVRVRAFV